MARNNTRNSRRSTAKTNELPATGTDITVVAADAVIDNDSGDVVAVVVDTGEGDAQIETVSQDDELAAAIAAEGQVPDSTDEQPDVTDGQPAESPADPDTGEGTDSDSPSPEEAAPAEAPAAEVVADPFADLPMTKIEDYEFRDFTDAVGNNPFKYEAVHTAAVAAKLPMKPGWKHSAAMVTRGQVRKEFKPGSVYGTIEQIVNQYGRAGVPAYVLVSKVRQAQIGNKRSKYCTALPPIGWAEGWLDTYISKNYGKVMEKKAPLITAEVVAEVQAADEVAEQAAEQIAA